VKKFLYISAAVLVVVAGSIYFATKVNRRYFLRPFVNQTMLYWHGDEAFIVSNGGTAGKQSNLLTRLLRLDDSYWIGALFTPPNLDRTDIAWYHNSKLQTFTLAAGSLMRVDQMQDKIRFSGFGFNQNEPAWCFAKETFSRCESPATKFNDDRLERRTETLDATFSEESSRWLSDDLLQAGWRARPPIVRVTESKSP
jgi:hypothetical protein